MSKPRTKRPRKSRAPKMPAFTIKATPAPSPRQDGNHSDRVFATVETPLHVPQPEVITLDKLQFVIAERISPFALESEVTVERITSDIAQIIETRARLIVAGEKLPVRTISYPATWWDAFKDRWFPVALLARWPAQFRTHTIQFAALYPTFRPKLEDYPWVPKVVLNRESIEE